MTHPDPIHVLAVATDGATHALETNDRIDVSAVTSIETAIRDFDRYGGVECVIADHDPPAIDGVALLEAIRSREPDLPVMLFAAGEAARRAVAAGATDTFTEAADSARLPTLVEEAVEHYRAKRDRLAAQARAAIHLDAARDAIAIVQDGRYVFANTRLLEFLGAERREHVIDEAFPGTLTIESVRLDEKRLAAVTNGERTLEAAAGTLEGPAGSFPVEVSAQSTEWVERPAAVLIVRDVSDVRRIQKRLRNYEQAVESSTDLLAALDADRRFLFANERYCAYHDVDQATIEGRSLADVLASDAYDRLEEHVDRVLAGEPLQYETVRDHPDLGTRFLDVRYYPLRGVDGEVRGYGSTIRDITERHERINQLGKIDRILRHNARNSLNVITGHAEMIESEGDVTARTHASKILETSDAVLDTFEKERRITSLLADAPHRERIDVVAVVIDAVGTVRERYPDARISSSTPPTAPIKASTYLSGAVIELVENAVVHADDPNPEVTVDVVSEDDTVVIEVGDNGPDIPDMEVDVMTDESAIDPLNHSRGLGLWFVSLVVRRSGGRLEFDANEPRGNVVRVILEE
ncbi:PAS domain-containing protein [Halorhabdus amylolytica]|uniref:PAS domain-containing protein n=1 Tax=Halorhabdus amylolytica TaxID=2559573 RepID=UPI0010A9FB54|nr:PAS domain-containing protein [Halorhabdus amylolytica]